MLSPDGIWMVWFSTTGSPSAVLLLYTRLCKYSHDVSTITNQPAVDFLRMSIHDDGDALLTFGVPKPRPITRSKLADILKLAPQHHIIIQHRFYVVVTSDSMERPYG